MSESSVPVNVRHVDYECDRYHCDGKMRPTGTVLTVYPPLYVHKCDQCGISLNLKYTYPRIEYTPIS